MADKALALLQKMAEAAQKLPNTLQSMGLDWVETELNSWAVDKVLGLDWGQVPDLCLRHPVCKEGRLLAMYLKVLWKRRKLPQVLRLCSPRCPWRLELFRTKAVSFSLGLAFYRSSLFFQEVLYFLNKKWSYRVKKFYCKKLRLKKYY